MRRITLPSLFFILFMLLTSFGMHKFYVSIHQIDYVPSKKRLEITSRIFTDDLNDALFNKYHHKTMLGEKNESAEDVALLQKYLAENFTIKLNGMPRPLRFLSHEFENNVTICYFSIQEATKIKTLEIRNSTFFELFPEQQHIINSTVFGEKQSLLLTVDNKSGVLK